MIENIRRHWFLWLISVVSAFTVGLLINFPATFAYAKLKPELPPALAKVINGIEGTIWDGSATLRQGTLESTIDWQLNPIDMAFGGPALLLHLHENDHDLVVKLSAGFGDSGGNSGADGSGNSGRVELAGVVDKSLINNQLRPYGIAVNNDVQLNALSVVLRDGQFSDGSGTVTWKGGTVSYNSPSSQSIQLPELHGLLSTENGVLYLNIVQMGGTLPMGTISFKADGWFSAEVKPAMAELVLLPNRRVNRAGNVLEIRRKVF